jgi:MFS family permease
VLISSESFNNGLHDDSANLDAQDLRRLDDSEGLQDRGKILFTASMGFFTDAYDLFIIGLVVVILKTQWGVTGGIQKLAVCSVALLTAAFGSWVFGWLADRYGRKSVYGWEMLVLAAGRSPQRSRPASGGWSPSGPFSAWASAGIIRSARRS